MSLRFGIVGLGNIGKIHLENLALGKVPGAVATAVCNRSRPSVTLPAGVLYFSRVQEMLDSGVVDAVVVSTPHPDHLRTGEAVLRHGLHLMMEKPITATKLEGERLLAVPRRQGQKFAMMLNVRTNPHFQRIKSLIGDGDLGVLQRVQWTITNWFRPEAYYASNAWRATWKDDGGGVLLNQALHNLDILQWLCGMPQQLRAF